MSYEPGSFTKELGQIGKRVAKSTALLGTSTGYLYLEHEYKKSRKLRKKKEEQLEREYQARKAQEASKTSAKTEPVDDELEYVFYDDDIKLIKKSLNLLLSSEETRRGAK